MSLQIVCSFVVQMMDRMPCVVVAAAVCLSVSLTTAGVTASTSPPSQPHHHQPPWTGTSNHRALASAAGSTFEAMMARRNHSVLLTANVGRLTADKKLLVSYQQSAEVATSGASSSQRVRFSGLSKLGMAFVDVARPKQRKQLP